MWKVKGIVAFVVFSCLAEGIYSRPEIRSQDPQWILELKLGTTNLGGLKPIINGISPVSCDSSKEKPSNERLNNTKEIMEKSTLNLVELDGSIYYFEKEKPVNYFEAMTFCKTNGMDLVSIETEAENEKLLKYIKANLNSFEHFWTSGNDLSAEGHFTWLATGEPFTYTNWKPSLPDNYDDEDCVELRNFGDGSYFWNDMKCMHSLNFICELKECTNFCLSRP
ncbi:collectin-11-like [Harmonia axyridis]|uniref:collectin-11-like n=1 Tax=Harmonia axyridis TaxID=115357 RepID=UPI001E2764A2|nr:collectin-11-like [Harmonia axyridis]